jgi:hypothetical protein
VRRGVVRVRRGGEMSWKEEWMGVWSEDSEGLG